MVSEGKLSKLREVITESLRVQRQGERIPYINVGNALQDACSRQNHAIFARRGCGKTLLLHESAHGLKPEFKAVYLNCEDFKRHSFPNVLVEILAALFREIDRNLTGWFGKKKRSKEIVKGIIKRLEGLLSESDQETQSIKRRDASEQTSGISVEGGADVNKVNLKAAIKGESKDSSQIERSFEYHREKLRELDQWLPRLKEQVREFFELSKSVKVIILQIDDLYHLKQADQAFVVDYIHRLCKDLPLYFKIATLRHASTLYVDREGQPIGAQERHDYQPINIDYTFGDFAKTRDQNWKILSEFAVKAGMERVELESLFKGEGFSRLVMAGGGVPRDVLSLFLEILGSVDAESGGKIGKDEVRILSRQNFERRIEELKQDSKGDEQDDLLKGIYIIREFCLEKKTNVFNVRERMLQQNDEWRKLFYRLMDYRIIHSCANALTHKSQEGTYQAFAIDIGCYAHLRKLQDRFTEIDVSLGDAKERFRSAPILDESKLASLFAAVPENVEAELLAEAA